MKISFHRQTLLNAMTPMMGCVSTSSTVPEVEGILIDATAGKCILTTFDLEKGMRLSVECDIEEEGKTILPAQKLLQTLRVMNGDVIELTVNDKLQACISSGISNHKMIAMNPELYPAVPRFITDDGFIIGQSVLKSMIKKINFAMATKDMRPVLNGAYFKIDNNTLTAVACDSIRIAKCQVTVDIQKTEESMAQALQYAFIIPYKSVYEIEKMLADDERKDVKIYTTRKNIVFHMDNFVFFSRLIEGQYIEYDRVIMSTGHRIFAEMNRADVIGALERASLVTEEKMVGTAKSYVKMNFEGNLLKVIAESAAGSTYDEVDTVKEGDDLVIAFNNRFLIDILKAGDSENIKFSMISPLAGINIEPVEQNDDSSEIYMILPIRMKD